MLWFSHAPRNAAAHFGVAPTQLSNEMKLEAGHIPCHLPCGDGAVSRIGDNTTVGFSSRTSGARSTWRECAENYAVFQCCQESVPASPVQASAERMARIFRSGISKAIDLRRKIARYFWACAPENRFVGCCWKFKFHSTTASSPTAHRQRPVNHGAADRSKSNLYQMAEQNTNPCFIPLRERLTCAAWRHRRRAAAGAPGAARPPPSAMWLSAAGAPGAARPPPSAMRRSKCAAGRRRRASLPRALRALRAGRPRLCGYRPRALRLCGARNVRRGAAAAQRCRGRSGRCAPAALGSDSWHWQPERLCGYLPRALRALRARRPRLCGGRGGALSRGSARGTARAGGERHQLAALL